MSRLKLIFMGTPGFSVPTFNALIASGHEICAVYTQPPRQAGRGHKMRPSPVQMLAEHHAIPVRHPHSLRKQSEYIAEFAEWNVDLCVTAAYGLILPREIIDCPKLGCLNVHASLLPRWRGAAPIQHAIRAGDAETGVTLMKMETGLDSGPILDRACTQIGPEETAADLHEKLARMGADLTSRNLDWIARNGSLPPLTPQDHDQATYAPMLEKSDGRIDWTRPAGEIDRQIRAFTPWPGTWCHAGAKRIKILKARKTGKTDKNAFPGTLINDNGEVVCDDGGTLQLLEIQPENARPMDIRAALNGHYLKIGTCMNA